MAYYPIQQIFVLGTIVFSSGAESLDVDLYRFIRRHMSGDWGDISDYDIEMNEIALATDGPLLSQYTVTDAGGSLRSLSIMTESDRSITVVWLNS